MTADNPQIPGPRTTADEAEDLFAAYRGSQALPQAVRARVRQRLLVAGAPAPEPAPPALLDRARRRRSAVDQRWWIAAAALLLLASAAIALLSGKQEGIVASRRGVDGAAYTADSAATRGDATARDGVGGLGGGIQGRPSAEAILPGEAAPAGAEQAGARSSGTATTTSTTSPATSPGATPATTDPVDRELRPAASAGSGASLGPAESPGRSSTPSLALTAEKTLLEGAWRALAAGDHQGARDALRRHRRDFAGGILSQEREVLEVLLACKTAAPGASEQAARFRHDHPASPWSARVDDVCPPPSSPQ